MKKTIDQVDVAGQRVLMRVDFNVPLDGDRITDDRRIRQSLPSVRSVVDRGGRLVLMSHLGRPKGKGPEPGLSLQPAADRLRELLADREVLFPSDDCADACSAEAVDVLVDGEIVVLENLRFHAGEKAGDAEFASRLASYGDIYCNNAFGTAHRTDASMYAVPMVMAGQPRVAGLLLAAELERIGGVVGPNAPTPRAAVLGGAKVSDKLGVIRNLMRSFDTIVIGGAMAYTLLRAQGVSVGASRVEADMDDEARSILEAAATTGTALRLPVDHACGRELSADTERMTTSSAEIDAGWMGLDVGPKTIAAFAQVLAPARTIVWNGPMGVFEVPPFDAGTRGVADAIVAATRDGATSVVGGGDTAAAVEVFGLAAGFTHISTGGGASLRMLEGRPFESVALLDDA